MKRLKLIILLLLGLLCNQAYSQPYKSIFGESTTKWYTYSIESSCGTDYSWSDILYTSMDTIINSKTYKKVLMFSSYDTSIYFLREDTNSSKVYMYWNNDEEILMKQVVSTAATP